MLPRWRPTFSTRLSARGAFLLNAAFVVGLLVLSQLPLLDARPVVRASIVGAALVLLAWSALLFGVLRRGQTVTFEVALRPQHYLQACLQGSLILYWGFYWREVYHAAPLILAQLLFAYGFDSLLSWTHRRTFALGFGPFPIIFSLTLFFWFKDPWFYWQFVMVAIGFLAKEFLRWQRDGVNTHIFNPSSFPLAVVSVVLLLFDATDMTWGFLVAETEFFPPHMYLAIFLIGMPGQYLFGVAPMTMAAVTTTFAFSAIYHSATGSYFFVDSHVPIAVFLGMTLLFTDPATSPRTLRGTHFLRRALRAHHRSPVRLAAEREHAGLLRQAAPGAAPQPVRHLARPAGEVAQAQGHRSVGVGRDVGAAPPSSRVHGRVGDRLRRDECVRASRRRASRAMDAVLGAGVRGR